MTSSSKKKINKKKSALNDTADQMDIIDYYRTFHPQTAEYTFNSSAHGTFSRIEHILGHKSGLSVLKKTEIISSIFSDQNAVRLQGKNCKHTHTHTYTHTHTNTWRLNNTLLNNQ